MSAVRALCLTIMLLMPFFTLVSEAGSKAQLNISRRANTQAQSSLCGFNRSSIDGHFSTLYASNDIYSCGFNLVLDPFDKFQAVQTANQNFVNVPCTAEGMVVSWTCSNEENLFKTSFTDDDGTHTCYLQSMDDLSYQLQMFCYTNSTLTKYDTFYRRLTDRRYPEGISRD
jgi:hypothetical protein